MDEGIGHAAGQEVFRRVAELHIACIDRGFLATLGPAFLSLMYQAIDEGEDSVLIVSRDQQQVVGFVAGASGMGPIYRRMLRHWPRLLASLLPAALSPTKLWRVLEIIHYSGRAASSRDVPCAELLSIGVDACYRGRGHADRLYQGLCDHFRSRGVHEFKIVVGSELRSAHNFYRRRGAMPLAELQVHKGETSTVYRQSVGQVQR